MEFFPQGKNNNLEQVDIYNYNDINPLNDYKINSDEQTKNANRIINQ